MRNFVKGFFFFSKKKTQEQTIFYILLMLLCSVMTRIFAFIFLLVQRKIQKWTEPRELLKLQTQSSSYFWTVTMRVNKSPYYLCQFELEVAASCSPRNTI